MVSELFSVICSTALITRLLLLGVSLKGPLCYLGAIHPPTVLVYGLGVSFWEFLVNCGYIRLAPLGNRRQSSSVEESLNFCPLARPEIAAFSAYVPASFPSKHKKLKCVEVFRPFALQ